MTEIALDEKALEAAKLAAFDQMEKDNSSFVGFNDEVVNNAFGAAIRAYLRASPSQVAPANPARESDLAEAIGDVVAAVISVEYATPVNMRMEKEELEKAKDRLNNLFYRTAAIGAGGQALVVKPLEWEKRYPSEFMSRAETIMGVYRVWSHHEANGEWYWSFDGLSSHTCLSEDEAKAAAQDEYQGRILSALSQPHPADERVEGKPVKLTYTNYRGETAQRTITPKRIWFGSTEWHLEPQWLLTAYDHDKQADRDFALKDFGAADERVVEALRKIEYCLTKDSLCEAEKIDDALKAVRRLIAAKEGR